MKTQRHDAADSFALETLKRQVCFPVRDFGPFYQCDTTRYMLHRGPGVCLDDDKHLPSRAESHSETQELTQYCRLEEGRRTWAFILGKLTLKTCKDQHRKLSADYTCVISSKCL